MKEFACPNRWQISGLSLTNYYIETRRYKNHDESEPPSLSDKPTLTYCYRHISVRIFFLCYFDTCFKLGRKPITPSSRYARRHAGLPFNCVQILSHPIAQRASMCSQHRNGCPDSPSILALSNLTSKIGHEASMKRTNANSACLQFV